MVKLILQNFLNMLMKVVIEKVTVTGMRSVQVQSESPGENLFHWMIQQKAACRHIRTTSKFFLSAVSKEWINKVPAFCGE